MSKVRPAHIGHVAPLDTNERGGVRSRSLERFACAVVVAAEIVIAAAAAIVIVIDDDAAGATVTPACQIGNQMAVTNGFRGVAVGAMGCVRRAWRRGVR